ncbi:MAG: hypothetical protein R3C14_22125 [Caldilineaceae bacterium]
MKWTFVTLLLLGATNFFWADGQWLFSFPVTARLSALERAITATQDEVEQLEAALQPLTTTLRQYKAEIAQLQAEIDDLATTYPQHNMPPAIYADYVAKVDRYNLLTEVYSADLIRYQTLYNDYAVKLTRYNALAEEGLGLAQQSDQNWGMAPRGAAFLY